MRSDLSPYLCVHISPLTHFSTYIWDYSRDHSLEVWRSVSKDCILVSQQCAYRSGYYSTIVPNIFVVVKYNLPLSFACNFKFKKGLWKRTILISIKPNCALTKTAGVPNGTPNKNSKDLFWNTVHLPDLFQTVLRLLLRQL